MSQSLESSTGTDEPVVVIKSYTVPAGEAEHFVEVYRENARIMSAQPGFVRSRLHRPLADGPDVRFVHVAEWRSGTELDEAVTDPEWRASVRRLFDDPGLHVVSEPASYRVAVELRPSGGAIRTVEDLRRHLQWAIELEHSTIPPYLCALYSLDPGRNAEAVQVVGSVLAEEMLHLALAANLLNAVGGKPVLDSPTLLPPYPHPLPHGDKSFEVQLVPFGPEALELFLRIERPASVGAPPEADAYETIGQFYAAVEEGMRRLCDELGEEAVFSGDPARQVGEFHLRGGGGAVVPVHDLKSALAALTEITEQGEGAARTDVWDGDRDVFHPEREEVAHYYRFRELQHGRRYQTGDTPQSGPTGEAIAVDFDAVMPVRPNQRSADQPEGSEIRVAQERFNVTYCRLLQELEGAFNGEPARLGATVGSMYQVKAQAQALMMMPLEDGETTAGPTFEYVPPDLRA
ncbi:ferritin-like domain-containing protein [Lentzea sp. NPDC055074]